jgi:hypothetical protein
MGDFEMVHPNLLRIRELQREAENLGWPWFRSFTYEVAVKADDLDELVPSDEAITIAEAMVEKLKKESE